MTTIRVVPDMDLNKDGKVSLGELVASGFVIFIGILSALLIVVGGIWSILFTEIWTIGKIIVAMLMLSTLVTVMIVLWRMFRYERGERRDNLEWLLERDKKEWELDQIKGVSQDHEETNLNQATQDMMARRFLSWSYQQGQFITREEWKAKGQSEVVWNRINRLMKEHRIRSKKSRVLQYTTFAEAWGAWCDAMMKSKSWVRSGEEFIKD